MARPTRVRRSLAVAAVAPAVLLGTVVARLESGGTKAAEAAPTACRQSLDPACGPLAWDPVPGNAELTVAVEVTPAHPRVGEEVTVRVAAADPDAPVDTNCGSWAFVDPWATTASVGYPCNLERADARFGTWAPPAPAAGSLEASFTHVFSRPGAYSFHFEARSGDPSGPGDASLNPYASATASATDIVVG